MIYEGHDWTNDQRFYVYPRLVENNILDILSKYIALNNMCAAKLNLALVL